MSYLEVEDIEPICDTIRNWPGDWSDLMAYVREHWAYADWGWGEGDDAEGARLYKISTAGWSENELLVAAMQENIAFWETCWWSSRRGGHYEFRMRKAK